jgi:hypothetical protein
MSLGARLSRLEKEARRTRRRVHPSLYIFASKQEAEAADLGADDMVMIMPRPGDPAGKGKT